MGANKQPHGGTLKNLYLPADQLEAEKKNALDYPTLSLTPRQLCDVELMLNGAFSPLEGFLGKADYTSVLKDMRLADGTLWPIPVNLDVAEDFAEALKKGSVIALRDGEGVLVAVMEVSDIWSPDWQDEARSVYGNDDIAHPGVNFLKNRSGPVYLGGRLSGVEHPNHYDFKHLRLGPQELRDKFEKMGWRRVVAFQARKPMHRAHMELTQRAAQETEANLLIQPVVGVTAPGDVDHFTRVRCYEHILEHYPEQTTVLSLLPLAMRLAGPREALWHAIIRKNYGCTHLIVGHNHASPPPRADGEEFYGPYEAQELFRAHEDELDISMAAFQQTVYVEDRAQYAPIDEIGDKEKTLQISAAELQRRLEEDLPIPDWFSYPAVIEELRKTHPPRHQSGFTVFFTGLSGSGKSTIANALMVKLMVLGGRNVTLLDGDIVRHKLSSELTFSKEHRDLNIMRLGFVAGEITRHRGIAICAPIAPYADTRRRVREGIEAFGGFLEVHVATTLETCEARDRKGLYAAARAGKIANFTGISDPYEAPENAEIVIHTEDLTPDLAAHQIILKLEAMGYIR